jgi:hypothetical protein
VNRLAVLLASFLLLALASPVQATPHDHADPQPAHGNDHRDNSTADHGHAGNATSDRGHGRNETADSHGPESLNLTGDSDNGHPRLNWTYHGHGGNHHFEVLRSVDGGNLTAYDTVPASSSSYTDPATTVGHIYGYAVRNIHLDSAPGVQSNTAYTDSFGCEWIGIAPGDPQLVLLHPECIPVVGPILDRIHPSTPIDLRH